MSAVRASYTIEPDVLRQFNDAVPAGERSRVVQRLIKRALPELMRAHTDIADEFETHPDFAQARADADAFDVTANDGLQGLP